MLWLDIPPSYDPKLTPLGAHGLFDKVLRSHAKLFESFWSKWTELREVTFRLSFPHAEVGEAFFRALGHRKRGPWRLFRNAFAKMKALEEVHFRFAVPQDSPERDKVQKRLWDATGEMLRMTSHKPTLTLFLPKVEEL